MKLNIHDEILMPDKKKIKAFDINTRKGYAHGFVNDNILCIHHIGTNKGEEHPIKGIMDTLVKTFKTNSFRFLMITNPELKNIIKGEVVNIPPDAEGNPFGEWIQEIHGEWNN